MAIALIAYNENEIHFHLPVTRFPGNKAMLQRRIDDHAPPSRESVREAQEIFYRHLKRVGLKHTDQRDSAGHTEKVAHLLFTVGNALDEAGLVDLQQAVEVFRRVVTHFQHENILIAEIRNL